MSNSKGSTNGIVSSYSEIGCTTGKCVLPLSGVSMIDLGDSDPIRIEVPNMLEGNAIHHQRISQIGYLMIVIDPNDRIDILKIIRDLRRSGDELTVVKPGHFIMAMYGVLSIEAMEIVVEKFKEKFVDHDVVVTGGFLPYRSATLNSIYQQLTYSNEEVIELIPTK